MASGGHARLMSSHLKRNPRVLPRSRGTIVRNLRVRDTGLKNLGG